MVKIALILDYLELMNNVAEVRRPRYSEILPFDCLGKRTTCPIKGVFCVDMFYTNSYIFIIIRTSFCNLLISTAF